MEWSAQTFGTVMWTIAMAAQRILQALLFSSNARLRMPTQGTHTHKKGMDGIKAQEDMCVNMLVINSDGVC